MGASVLSESWRRVALNEGNSEALAKLDQYSPWLKSHFSKDNAIKIILEDFGSPVRD